MNTNNTKKISNQIKLISIVICAAFMIKLGFIVFKELHEMNNSGWSITNNKKEIDINIDEYSEAMNCWSEGDRSNAELLFARALSISNDKNGEGSLASAAISQKLGALYIELENYSTASRYLTNAYVTFRSALGEEDGNTITAKAQLASCDLKSGYVDRGYASLNDVYDSASFIPQKMEICLMLAQCETFLGNYNRALEWYNLLGEYYRGLNIKNSSWILLLNDLGYLWIEMGNYNDAEYTLKLASSDAEEQGLENNPLIRPVYSNLAYAYAFNEKRSLAVETYEKAISKEIELYGENSTSLVVLYNGVADMYSKLNEPELAMEFLDKALNICLSTNGDNHPKTASIYKSMGDVYEAKGDLENAVEYHSKALEIQKNLLEHNSYSIIICYEALAEDYLSLMQYDTGIEMIEKALQISTDLYKDDNLYLAHCYITAAWLYSNINNFDEALQLAEKALDMCERINVKSSTFAYAYQTMGYVKMKTADYNAAIINYEKAVSLYNDLMGQTSIETGNTLEFMGDTYQLLEDYDNAVASLIKAENILSHYPGKYSSEGRIDLKLHSIFETAYKSDGIDYETWLLQQKEKLSDLEDIEKDQKSTDN